MKVIVIDDVVSRLMIQGLWVKLVSLARLQKHRLPLQLGSCSNKTVSCSYLISFCW